MACMQCMGTTDTWNLLQPNGATKLPEDQVVGDEK